VQPVEKTTPTRVGKRLEHLVHLRVHEAIMQPFGCMSRAVFPEVGAVAGGFVWHGACV
jgi:hypothetical protein